jgi:hypothetical protein
MHAEPNSAEERIAELEEELAETREELERVAHSRMFMEAMFWFLLAIYFAWSLDAGRYWVTALVMTQIVVAIVWNVWLFLRALKKWRSSSLG